MKILTIIVLLLLPLPMLAQQQDSVTFKTGGYFGMNVNGARPLTDLNRQLQMAGHSPLVEALIGFTVGMTNRFADQNFIYQPIVGA